MGAKAAVGAATEVGVQIVAGMAQGKTLSQSARSISWRDVGMSAALSAATAPGVSVARNLAKAGLREAISIVARSTVARSIIRDAVKDLGVGFALEGGAAAAAVGLEAAGVEKDLAANIAQGTKAMTSLGIQVPKIWDATRYGKGCILGLKTFDSKALRSLDFSANVIQGTRTAAELHKEITDVTTRNRVQSGE